MRYFACWTSLVAILLPAISVEATAASVINGNPPGVQYCVVLSNNTQDVGSAVVSSAPNGTGGTFVVTLYTPPPAGQSFGEHGLFWQHTARELTTHQATTLAQILSQQTAAVCPLAVHLVW